MKTSNNACQVFGDIKAGGNIKAYVGQHKDKISEDI